jgi:hypothetical protein
MIMRQYILQFQSFLFDNQEIIKKMKISRTQIELLFSQSNHKSKSTL